MATIVEARRRSILAAGTGLILASTAPRLAWTAEEKKTGAVEDLMREHGVLRRVLLVYRETAAQLRADPAKADPKPLHDAAMLFRNFGEDYHEKKLEEARLFPAIRKAGGPAASYVDVLIAQHNRGREITDYILAVTGKGAIGATAAEPLASVFDTLALMYDNHAAREDTIVFPAWKEALSENQLEEMGEEFEDIERQQFGKDGFDEAVAKIGAIEQALGFADLGKFTAPPPPKT